MKISQRLEKIASMVQSRYDHIWDCCCDHGLLGAKLLDNNSADTVHFVDVVPELMQQVSTKLERFYPSPIGGAKRWQVHCIDVAQLPLANKEQTQLVIIAGVGGELLVELVQAILARNPQHTLEFILCPVHHIFEVRKALATLQLGLIDEHLMEENQRFYEVLHVSTQSQLPIALVGEQMWDITRSIDLRYLQKTLDHYQRIQVGLLQKPNQDEDKNIEITQIINAYKALQPQNCNNTR
ncbi:tRNA (adenine(22)-N(1))-methyltransferase TrmK [Shewanella sp. KX20019]|uniref:tRNA (adenine(22)-N(1))-methyltransferase n=1 Tax=Shewanella sp. KX20019 TaxID=2803864 RepID=UPI00192804AC|nr:tRNA (adenine(22)-N(1))-methyltransferase TrmK [Shewanella sp. KX20019]QQX79090.1 tRNA (adenine(22)-N(1))-methyltransferase TrmK [Shewanella sp. KX20019]